MVSIKVSIMVSNMRIIKVSIMVSIIVNINVSIKVSIMVIIEVSEILAKNSFKSGNGLVISPLLRDF